MQNMCADHMSDDKAGRLREIADSGAVGALIRYDLCEAADEIERYRDALASLRPLLIGDVNQQSPVELACPVCLLRSQWVEPWHSRRVDAEAAMVHAVRCVWVEARRHKEERRRWFGRQEHEWEADHHGDEWCTHCHLGRFVDLPPPDPVFCAVEEETPLTIRNPLKGEPTT